MYSLKYPGCSFSSTPCVSNLRAWLREVVFLYGESRLLPLVLNTWALRRLYGPMKCAAEREKERERYQIAHIQPRGLI